MRLNRSTGHAIRIMLECSRVEPRLVKVADLAASLDLSMQNVFKIVHILSRAELVVCARGRHGGVRLARAAEKICLGDIVRAMEATNLAEDDRLPLAPPPSSGETDVNLALELALGAFIDVLDQHTLAAMTGRMPLSKGASDRKDIMGDMRRTRGARGASASVTG
jgi:Rrf2 family nitric oxide-sensitive transcriptional repressor